MEDFPANSKKVKEPVARSKRVEKVVTSEVVRRKTPLGRRFRETFVEGDAQGVVNYVVMDVLLPAAKDMVADATSQGIERMLFGEVRSTSRRSTRASSQPHTSYSSMYGRGTSSTEPRRDRDPRDDRPRVRRPGRGGYDFREIVLASRPEAEMVLERLYDLLERYEEVSVADFNDLLGITGEFTDDRHGWRDLRGSDVRRVPRGYIVDLPQPNPLS